MRGEIWIWISPIDSSNHPLAKKPTRSKTSDPERTDSLKTKDRLVVLGLGGLIFLDRISNSYQVTYSIRPWTLKFIKVERAEEVENDKHCASTWSSSSLTFSQVEVK
jgi:hypothetical protein